LRAISGGTFHDVSCASKMRGVSGIPCRHARSRICGTEAGQAFPAVRVHDSTVGACQAQCMSVAKHEHDSALP
jgi:hypothetical protein